MKSKVSMQDIADYVGVSKVTVSKVLRGKSDISEPMRRKILDAVANLGYIYLGDKTERRKTSKISVLTAEHFFGGTDCFYVKLYKHLSEELAKMNVDAVLGIVDQESESNLIIPESLKGRQFDGIIVMGQLSRKYLKKLMENDIPLVFLDFYYEGFDVTSVNTDNFFGTYELTARLIQCGHTKIGFVGNIDYTSSIQDRFLGYYKALIEHHIPINWEWILNDRYDDGHYLDIKLPETMPSAFVCNCDEVAALLIKNLERHGLHVPQDISVTGFDDSAHATRSNPAITTVHVNLEEMARLTAKAAMRDMGNIKYSARILVKGKIVIRDSVSGISS